MGTIIFIVHAVSWQIRASGPIKALHDPLDTGVLPTWALQCLAMPVGRRREDRYGLLGLLAVHVEPYGVFAIVSVKLTLVTLLHVEQTVVSRIWFVLQRVAKRLI